MMWLVVLGIVAAFVAIGLLCYVVGRATGWWGTDQAMDLSGYVAQLVFLMLGK